MWNFHDLTYFRTIFVILMDKRIKMDLKGLGLHGLVLKYILGVNWFDWN